MLGLIVVATLATPEPAVARFVLAFAGLVLAAAVPATEWFQAEVVPSWSSGWWRLPLPSPSWPPIRGCAGKARRWAPIWI